MVSEQGRELFLQAVKQLDGKKPFSSLDDLLESFGLDYESALSNEKFVKASIWSLAADNPFSEDYKSFLVDINPQISSRYLVGALGNPMQREPALEILLQYGSSQVTVNPLVGALGNPVQKDYATNILVIYGKDALQFIREPIPGTRLYEPLLNVINTINKAA